MSDKPSLYLARGIIGNEGMPGAPLLHFQLSVDATTGSLSGHAWITQATGTPQPPPVKVSGQLRKTGFGNVTQIGHFESAENSQVASELTAHFAVDNKWNGRGGFDYDRTRIEDVPVVPQQ